MDRVTLGRTGLNVCKNGFGALPIQRISCEEAAKLIVKAYQNGRFLACTVKSLVGKGQV